MVIKQFADKITDIVKKYRYVLIILLIGLILMLIPSKNTTTEDVNVSLSNKENSNSSTENPLEQRLSDLLSKVEGAGNVEVILTIETGEEIIYQTNDDQVNSDTSFSSNTDTVTVTDSNRNQTGLIKQIKAETYKGAIIVCRGADNPTVCLKLVDAVSRITGLRSNCISVLKMK